MRISNLVLLCALAGTALGCDSILGIDDHSVSREISEASDDATTRPAEAGDDGATATEIESGDDAVGSSPIDSPAPTEAQSPDFLLTAASAPAQVRVVRGQSVTIALDVAGVGGFSGDVTVSVTGLSAGVTAAPLTISAGAGEGILAIQAGATSTLGAESITVNGTAGSLVHSLALTLVVQDAPGSGDTTFGTGGRVVIRVGTASNDIGTGGLALQSDGLVVCGNARTAQGTTAVSLTRLTLQGALDPTFGMAGTTLANRSGSTLDVCGAVSILPSGAIALGGFTLYSTMTGAHSFLVARFTGAGALDTTFGGTGFVATPFGTSDAKANGMVAQSDGKLVLGGFGGGGLAFARYGIDGSLDATFGPDATGLLVTNFANTGAATAVALQASGDVIAPIQFATFLLLRYTPVGVLDSAFGSGGHVTLDVGDQGSSTANYALVEPDGAIVVAGSATISGGTQGMGVARFASTGVVDTSFGTAGSVVLTFAGGAAVAHAAAVGADGAIALAGESFVNGASAFTVARLAPDGTIDPLFGTGGRSTFESGGTAEAIAVDALGRIVVAGRITDGSRTSFVVYRLWP